MQHVPVQQYAYKEARLHPRLNSTTPFEGILYSLDRRSCASCSSTAVCPPPSTTPASRSPPIGHTPVVPTAAPVRGKGWHAMFWSAPKACPLLILSSTIRARRTCGRSCAHVRPLTPSQLQQLLAPLPQRLKYSLHPLPPPTHAHVFSRHHISCPDHRFEKSSSATILSSSADAPGIPSNSCGPRNMPQGAPPYLPE